ncbi:MBL fold metallo-hydrolase [Candidatus Woesearchaeota archaeon]|nr:MBL fold metallo-hydrolase [Candidatus Woesearchaeota archaeon]
MIFNQIDVGPMQNFVYFIGDEISKEAAVIDAGWDVDKIINTASQSKLEIKKIILTHSHFDHVQGVSELADKISADVYFHELESNSIKKHIKNGTIKTINLKDNDEINVGKIKIKVVHTPGHTLGSICLLAENKLLTGDTLFVGAIGRTDLPGGDALKLFESLQKLKKLDDKTEIYPGHDYGETRFSTIGNEKKNNPYFMCKNKEEFMKLVGIF